MNMTSSASNCHPKSPNLKNNVLCINYEVTFVDLKVMKSQLSLLKIVCEYGPSIFGHTSE